MGKLDEVALNTLLAEGIDVPTAYAASIDDSVPTATRRPHSRNAAWTWGLIVGMFAWVAWSLI